MIKYIKIIRIGVILYRLPLGLTAMWFAFLAQKITAQPETHLWTCGFLCCVALVT